MRLLVGLVAGTVLFCALIVQAVTSLALASYAIPPAWMRAAPLAWSQAAARAIDAGFPSPGVTRVALIRVALKTGDIDAARRRIEALPASAERTVLEAKLAEQRGDDATAVDAYVRGGDALDADRLLDALVSSGRVQRAIVLQRDVLQRLGSGAESASTRAEAWWRLGELYQSAAYALAPANRQPLQRQAAAAYERAAALAPLSQKFLLAAANEYLNLAQPSRARTFFERLLKLDPAGVDALLGLADVSVRNGDASAARAYLNRARAAGNDPRIQALEGRLQT